MPKGIVPPIEFKREVANMALDSGKTQAQLARDFGISKTSVGRYTSAFRDQETDQPLYPAAKVFATELQPFSPDTEVPSQKLEPLKTNAGTRIDVNFNVALTWGLLPAIEAGWTFMLQGEFSPMMQSIDMECEIAVHGSEIET